MKGGMENIMQQARQMQDNMEKVQKELAAAEVIGESGAGLVKVTMNGRHDVKQVFIDPSLMKEDQDMMEDLIAAAINDANRRVEAMTQERMANVTASMGLPPGMKLPF